MRNITTFKQANQALNRFISAPGGPRRYTLDRMRQLMNYLGNPQNKLKIIHVAGTSGKTSTSYYITSLLKAAGYITGLTVSPHVDEVNERSQINLSPLPEIEFCSELNAFLDIIDVSDIHPSYFELLIAFSFWLFEKRAVDYAVVEVGIGGLLDSTNVASRQDKICVITDIGLDHTEILGNMINEIAAQKAGIIKYKNSVFINAQSSTIMNVVKDRCQAVKAELCVSKNHIDLSSLPLFQQRNFDLAYAVASRILVQDGRKVLSSQKIHSAAKLTIPARMEPVKYRNKLIIMDGSHNEQKVTGLVESMKGQFDNRSINLLVSFGDSKLSGVLASLKLLSQLGSGIVITDYSYKDASTSTKRAVNTHELEILARQAGFQTIIVQPNPELAFNAFVSEVSDVGLITGSFYLLNHARKIIFYNHDE